MLTGSQSGKLLKERGAHPATPKAAADRLVQGLPGDFRRPGSATRPGVAGQGFAQRSIVARQTLQKRGLGQISAQKDCDAQEMTLIVPAPENHINDRGAP
jgi:hypothetical protein